MTEKPSGIDLMSQYERKAWVSLVESAHGKATETRRSRALAEAKQKAMRGAQRAKGAIERVPGSTQVIDGFDASVHQAVQGLHTLTVERGLNSVRLPKIVKAFGAEGVKIAQLEDIREVDLRHCDRSLPRKREGYLLAGTAEGVMSSLAVTGAMVSSTVTGGTTAAVAIGAVSADVVTVLIGMGRIVALVAAHYGYDVREPDEQVFAAGVLAYSSAGNAAEKAASLASLSRLTQTMMRRATWKQLSSDKLVRIIQGVFASLGLRLTHKKLAQAVPVVGAVINGGMNAHFVNQTFARAQQAYRLRFLTEKYEMDSAVWAPSAPEDRDQSDSQMPRVDELVESQIAK
ncbi:EcsC family protein [Rhodococcus ruber]|uniref:EcsC family protein n=1 Tax=Rhodococcus TaxID=1827 RepID=UPI00200C4AD0|nr:MULTISPECIES: EcsC family protein [Rhodococcus]UQB70805.1 EcsC family protein [Rhodococcus ruber]WML65452.1 EcsC family protein [Rhodococcus sp. AH-ZY2]